MVMLYPQDERINVLAPIVRGREGRVQEGARGAAGARLHARAHRRPVPLARRGHQARSPAQPHHRSRRRSADRPRRASSGGSPNRSRSRSTLADDIVVINTLDGGDRLFSRRLACVDCGISMPEMTPRAFSFNSPHGACPECQGLGRDRTTSIPQRARARRVASLLGRARSRRGRGAIASSCAMRSQALSSDFGIDLDVPFAKLPKKQRDILLFGARPRRAGATPPKKSRGRAAAIRSARLRRRDSQPAAPLRRGHAGPSRRSSSRTARCGRVPPAAASG